MMKKITAHIQSEPKNKKAALAKPNENLIASASTKLKRLRDELIEKNLKTEVVDKLVKHIENADDLELDRLRVIPHFVERRTLSLSAEEARARLGLSDRRIVTLLGFVYGRKGHRYAVEAVPYLPDDVVMVYAGGPVAGRS